VVRPERFELPTLCFEVTGYPLFSIIPNKKRMICRPNEIARFRYLGLLAFLYSLPHFWAADYVEECHSWNDPGEAVIATTFSPFPPGCTHRRPKQTGLRHYRSHDHLQRLPHPQIPLHRTAQGTVLPSSITLIEAVEFT
jgi:hypothetical protein